MTALILRLFWESQHILFFCSSSPPYSPCTLMLSQGLLFLRTCRKAPTGVWSLCCQLGDAMSVLIHAAHRPAGVQGIWGVPGPVHCHLMATASLSLACRGSAHPAAVSRAEQSNCICPVTKANLSVVPSVLHRQNPASSLEKAEDIFRICGKDGCENKMLRTGRSLDNTKTDRVQQNKHLQKQIQERKLPSRKHNIDWIFHLVSSPLPFIHVVILFYSGEQMQRVFHSSEMLWQCRSPNSSPCHASEGTAPSWLMRAPDSSGWHWLPQPSFGSPLPAARSHSCDPKHSCGSFFKSQEGELQTVWKVIKSGKLF